jgi:phospholipase/carboxylesterase
MDWIPFSRGHRLDPIEGGLPDAVVVLLHDLGESTEALLPVAARWAQTVPTTAFIVFDGIEQFDAPVGVGQLHTTLDLDVSAEPVLDRVAQHLESLTAEQQRSWQLGAGRLVLVGFRTGGTVALHLALRRGWGCAGVLAFSARSAQPLTQLITIGPKIRLIESVEARNGSHAELRDVVTSLVAYGVDARGVLLDGSILSDESIRYGGAYLVELIATAQRGDRFHGR